MPYVDSFDRQYLQGIIDKADDWGHMSSGQLNYVITKLLLNLKPTKYDHYNTLVGVLECCKLEFYRRAVAAYEDEKIKENGDVYS